MKLGLVAFALSLSLGAAACAKPSLVPPAGFAAVDDRAYDYRATSAQGLVVAARALKNEPAGDLDFWSHAIDLRLRRDGYTPTDAPRDVTSARGLAGKQLRYARTEAGRSYAYWLTLFLTEKKIYVVEAGGDEEDFKGAEAAVAKAVLTLK